jgi:alpha-tubulin suppressor-like RCC1 family protein
MECYLPLCCWLLDCFGFVLGTLEVQIDMNTQNIDQCLKFFKSAHYVNGRVYQSRITTMKQVFRQYVQDKNRVFKLFAWGHNGKGQCGDGTKRDRQVTPVRVVCGEWNEQESFRCIAAGLNSSFAVTLAGRVFSWGEATLGRLAQRGEE